MALTNLQAERNAFIGRGSELAQLQRHLRAGKRLISVVGPPGVGKTRLSRELGRWVMESGAASAGGAWFCDLSSVRTPDELCGVIFDVLGVRGATRQAAPGQTSVEQLGRILALREPTLLILDNFEDLVASAAPAIATWLGVAPEVTFLLTSRERLLLEQETALPLHPLPLDEAVLLLDERMRWARGGGDAGTAHDDRGILRDIAQALDGLPLALELAAGWAHLLSPEEILRRLHADRRFLKTRRRDVPARHSTLQRAIACSWVSLSAWEQSALGQCSVFRGGFDLGAAEAVIDLSAWPDAPETLDVLELLVAKSLVSVTVAATDGAAPTTAPLFRLYAAIREYAQDAAEAVARQAAEQRHARYYCALGERLFRAMDGEHPIEARAQLEGSYADLVAAYERSLQAAPQLAASIAVSLYPIHLQSTSRAVRQRWVEDTLAAAQRSDDARLKALALMTRADAGFIDGTDVEGDLLAARECAHGAQLPELEAQSMQGLGYYYFLREDFGRATELLTSARDLARRASAPLRQAWCEMTLALVCMRTGQPARAAQLFEEALALCDNHRLVRLQAMLLINYGQLEIQRGQQLRARELLGQGAALNERLGNRRSVAAATAALGCLDLLEGQPQSAQQRSLEALGIALDSGDRVIEATALFLSGCIATWNGDYRAAARALRRSVELHAALHLPRDQGIGLAVLAVPLMLLEGRQAALAFLEQARAVLAAADTGAQRAADAVTQFLGESRIDAALGDEHRDDPEGSDIEVRLIRCVLARVNARTGVEVSQGRISLGASARWIRLPDGRHIDLSRRSVSRRLLRALALQHVKHRGSPMGVFELIDVVWPKAALHPDIGRNRLHNALNGLRKLGLDQAIVFQDDGYMIDPALELDLLDVQDNARAGSPATPALTLEVWGAAQRVRLPEGRELRLQRRGGVRKLLEGLFARHLTAPGAPCSVYELFELAWPEHQIDPERAAHRVHAAVSELRKLGLGPILLTGPDGYCLHPRVTLKRHPL